MNMVFKSILAVRRHSIATLVFFALLSITHAQSVWDGTTANTAWHTGDGPYAISSAEDLAGLRTLVNGGNNFASKTINLAANIALNNTSGWESWGTSGPANSWTPIGTSTTAQQFQGTFDGNGYVVSGVYINSTAARQGLFGYVGTSGIIKNLGITASYVKGGDPTGGMVGNNYGQVSNSYSIGTIVTAGSSSDVGGLIGANRGSVNNSYSTGLVTGGGTSYGGGLVGTNSSGGTVNNSYYDKTTSGKTDTGKGEGKTTAEMQSEALVESLNFTAGLLSMNGWSYSANNYPALLSTPAANPLDGKFASGTGTDTDPFIISTATHLKNLSSLASKTDFKGYYFKLGQNISFSALDNPFTAIGSNAKPFNGTFDGDNKTISGVSIAAESSYQGLFGYIGSSGTLKNLGVAGSVQGGEYVGGLAGYNSGTISGSHFAGTVEGEAMVGGLAGNNTSTISNSYSTGTVEGEQDVGGLVGNNTSASKINNSYSTSAVTAEDYAGGLAGTNNGAINNSYSTGAVSGESYVGGLVGRNSGTSVIYSSYSTGMVAGISNVGGLAGNNASTSKINYSYYNNTVNSSLDDPRNEGKSTADMKAELFARELSSIAALIAMNGWVFNSGAYPTISNELAVEDMNFFFASGDGTEESPYLINTQTHLKNLSWLVDFGRNFQDKFLKLGQNIILDVSNWIPIGTYNAGSSPINRHFNGTFDGNNHTISGVIIGTPSANAQGLFGSLDAKGTVKNLGILESSIKGTGSYTGGLAGNTNSGAKIENCYFSGAVNGASFTGGLVGFNGGAIINSHSAGTVTGTTFTGGLAGGNQPGTITGSYSTSNVTGTTSVGGLAGRQTNSPAVIENSYSTGTVNGNESVGGFVGDNSRPINNSYSTGTATGTGNNVGGFVGLNTSATISNSYSTGAATGGANNVGGFVGRNNGTNTQINSSYSIGLATAESASNIGGFIGDYTSCASCTINSGYYDKTINSTLGDPRNEGKITTEMQTTAFVDELNNIAGLLGMKKWVIGGYPTLSTEVAPANMAPYFAGGNGTEGAPYLISTPVHLKNLSWLVDFGINFQGEFLKLAGDIALNDNAEDWETWNVSPPANSWARIGSTSAKAFQGTLDGNGKVVSGIYYYTSGTADYNGLFGYLGTNGTIKNLGVSNSYIKCEGSTWWVGGIVGDNYGTISNSYSTAWVVAPQYVGGLVGRNYGTVRNSYSTGKVDGTNNLGGLVGQNNYSTSLGTGKIENSYSTGLVTGSGANKGGLVGNYVTNSVITSSYYDNTVNSALTDSRSEGKTTEEMKQQATFAEWDFTNTWGIDGAINEGYPHLLWEMCNAEGKVFENGQCKLEGTFPSLGELNTTYTPTLSLDSLDLPVNYAWVTSATVLNAGNEQIFTATYTDPSGNYTTAKGNVTVNVAKANGKAVAAPVLAAKTHNSISISTVAPPSNGQYVEYRISTAPADATATWQAGLTFASLLPETDYYIFARAAENANYNAGEASASLHVKTDTQSSSSDNASSSSVTGNTSSSSTATSSSSYEVTPIRLPQIASSNIRVQAIGNSIVLENLPKNAKAEVYNLQGKQIYSAHSGNSQILRILVQTKGMYIVKTTLGSETKILKVLVK